MGWFKRKKMTEAQEWLQWADMLEDMSGWEEAGVSAALEFQERARIIRRAVKKGKNPAEAIRAKSTRAIFA